MKSVVTHLVDAVRVVDPIPLRPIAFGATFTAAVCLLFSAVIWDAEEWRSFATENGCRVTETRFGSFGESTPVATSEVIPAIATTAGRKRWVCSDETVRWK
jgi:hypothetical protein